MPEQAGSIKTDSTNDKLQKVWPTLFIGVGGTGMEIALRVRRRLLNHIWGSRENPVRLATLSEFSLAQFINFDLDAGSVTETGLAAATDPLAELVKFSEEEKLILKLDLDKYLRTDGELNRYRTIASWFPLTRRKVLELGIDPGKGAGQIRSLSRLYFFDKYIALRSVIESKIQALLAGVSNKVKTERLGLELEVASLRVVVIASTAGGTGSGSFLDMGFLAKWLANKQLRGSKVDLLLMLPSGYSGHGKLRTEANSYAALMEMETCIAQGLQYVQRWKDGEDPELPARPYDEVFLFDTGNLALKKTSRATDLFDMMADILFEDFTSAEFAARKRSNAVNQNQYKIDSFLLPVDQKKYGSMKMMYSKAYSAFGQSIIDTQLEQRRDEIACGQVNDMLTVFFGIGRGGEGGSTVLPPTPDEGRNVLREHVYCGREDFRLSYEFNSQASPYFTGIEYVMHKLVGHLLYENDKPMLGRLHGQINDRISDIIASTEKDQRLKRVDEFRAQLDRDLGLEGDAIDAGARGLENSVQARRVLVFKNLTDETSSLLKALWAAVDNKSKGGLDYTIQLIERIKDEIENEATGMLQDMQKAQKWFSGLCDKFRGDELQVLKEHLNQCKGRGFFGGGNKQQHAEAKLQQMGEAIRWYAEARLRSIACREAATLLRDFSSWLGQHTGLDERTNRKRWSAGSFAGKLAAYEKLVVDIMSDMHESVLRTREATKQGHASYQIVKASTAELDAARNLDSKKAMEWAESVFDNLGGSRAIFQKLENETSRVELISQLRGLALSHLPSLGSGEDNPLITAISEMSEPERSHLFQHCLGMAMPWIEANLEGVWTVNQDQYACIVGVSGAKIFERRFGDEFKKAIPARSGVTAKKINFYETSVSGKLTCYVEISGVPLLSLNLLSNWRDSYNEESKKIPVHAHKDKTLFVHPMAPNEGTLDRLSDHFKLYVQGVILGVLKIRMDDPEERVYCITISGEELSIGNERTIRMEGVSAEHLGYLQKRVTEVLDNVKSIQQVSGLVALYDFYSQRVYPPAKIKNEEKVEVLAEGFGNVMSANLKKEVERLSKKKATALDFDIAELVSRMKSNLDKWTDEIEGSETDVYESEVGRMHGPKRILKAEFFNQDWLASKFPIGSACIEITGQQPHSFPSDTPPPPPPGFGRVPPLSPPIPQPTYQYWLALNGQQSGPHPFAHVKAWLDGGQIPPNTFAFREGLSQWVSISQIPELSTAPAIIPPPLPFLLSGE